MGLWGRWRARHPKKYAGAEWSTRDAAIIGFAVALLALGGIQREFVYLSLMLWVAAGIWWTVRFVKRRQVERVTDETSVFWADQIK